MSKSIHTLVEDIYGLFGSGIEFDKEIADKFGSMMAETVSSKVPRQNKETKLWMSNIGQPCERKLWYSINEPDKSEPMSPETLFKFTYGDILEEVVLYLAAEAGHRVEGMQDRMTISSPTGDYEVSGKRDAVIDGVTVDVKSASSYSFSRFASGLTPENDKFGYIDQLQQYLYASQDDPLVTEKDYAAFLVVDKTLGKICLDVHKKNGVDYSKVVQKKAEMVASYGVPSRAFNDVQDGASGNKKLSTNCSYCGFKEHCWPGLRTFAYSNGPKFLTKVAKLPNVPEVT